MGKSKNQKPKKTVMTRIDEQTHRKLSAYKALYGCKTLSQAINKLLEGGENELRWLPKSKNNRRVFNQKVWMLVFQTTRRTPQISGTRSKSPNQREAASVRL